MSIAARLLANGTFISSMFDEITQNTISIQPSTVYASGLDEVTSVSNSAMRQVDGQMFIAGQFMEIDLNPLTVPDAPTGVTATSIGATTASVTFNAPVNDGGTGITSYTAVSTPGNITNTLNQANSGTFNVTGLTTGTNYTFTVYATNTKGNSSSVTSNSVTPTATAPTFTVSDAPTIGTATATSSTTATVPFTAPANNGGTQILSYTAISTPGNITGTISQSGSGTINITGLTSLTSYTFTVYATNSAGNSVSSSVSNSITTNDNTWSTIALMNGSTARGAMQAVTVNSSGLFVAVGRKVVSTVSQPVFATSTNGTTWTTPANINGNTTYKNMVSVAVDSSGKFVAVGRHATNFPNFAYATSTDGSNWNDPTTITGSTTVNSVAVNSSGRFVAVGTDRNGAAVFNTSADGYTWTAAARMNGSSTAAEMRAVAVNSSGLWVALGRNGVAAIMVSTSTDGTTWTTPAYMNGNSTIKGEIKSMTVDSSGKFVAVGYELSGGAPIYATSTDGTTWTKGRMNESSAFANMFSVAVNSSGKWVAVGNDLNGAPIYATSTDGTTWTTPALMNGSSTAVTISSVAVNSSGLFVAVGYDSTTSAPSYTVYS
jgi:hypothetical protein